MGRQSIFSNAMFDIGIYVGEYVLLSGRKFTEIACGSSARSFSIGTCYVIEGRRAGGDLLPALCNFRMDAVCWLSIRNGKLDVGGAANAELGYRPVVVAAQPRAGVAGRQLHASVAAHAQCALPLPGSYEACDEVAGNISGRSDIEHLQEVVVQLPRRMRN
jgi:hypothetical protein